jgi:hypothetical protein
MPSKRDPKLKANLSDFLAKARENQIEITAGDEVFFVDPPQLWSDKATTLGADNDPVGMATEILGVKEYAKWTKAGGNANALLAMVGEALGVSDLGKS